VNEVTPETSARMTVLQLIMAAIFIAGLLGGAGYSVGIVHAHQKAHEGADGHKGALERIRKIEEAQIKIATILDRLERRGPP